jgi:GTP-binding protein
VFDGQIGEEKIIGLELKVIADVGLIGFPNAGKSTLISKISNSKPKIADYPFTTLVPNLGIVKYDEFNSFVVADIPGLIEGASDGKGLGSQFLRHIERTRILVYLINVDSKDIVKDYNSLQFELKKHDKKLLQRPSLLLITKLDIFDNRLPENIKKPSNIETIPISSLNKYNLNQAIQSITSKLGD